MMINNNYFISKATLSQYSLKSKQILEMVELSKNDKKVNVSKEERDLVTYTDKLYFEFNSRMNICKGLDIHYWVMDNTDEPFLTYCYFCDVKLTEWTQKNRENKK